DNELELNGAFDGVLPVQGIAYPQLGLHIEGEPDGVLRGTQAARFELKGDSVQVNGTLVVQIRRGVIGIRRVPGMKVGGVQIEGAGEVVRESVLELIAEVRGRVG